MRPFFRSIPVLVGLALVVIALVAIGFVPLFAGPGYESALAAGILLPFVVSVVVALETSAAAVAPLDALGRGLANGIVFAAFAYLTTLFHGQRYGFCDVSGGSLLFALGPGVGALLAGAWGALAGALALRCRARRRAAVLFALAAPLASIIVSLGRFYASPMVFAFDPFVGYFSGSIYDTVVDASGLISYRAGSVSTLLAAYVAALLLGHDEAGRITYRAARWPATPLLGLWALAGSLGAVVSGDRLGHWQTPDSIAATLGARISGERCDVVYPRGMPLDEVQRFTRECDAHVRAGEAYFQTQGPPRITAYLFADAAQKGALMGAASTYIAKPWRREIYVQATGYPHPVLGHEIMHVIAGSFGRGPFKIAGRLGGLLPDPGLIEGVAVAASPHTGDLGPREWARAMKDLEILPPLSRIFALGFFGENSSMAYTVSGAFVAYIHDRFGAEAIRAWYGGRSLPEVTGSSWAALEEAWHHDLDEATLPDAAMAQARARFDRPSLFVRRCPHRVDECKARADTLRGAGDEEGAIDAYREALAFSPEDAMIHVGIAESLYRAGRTDEAKQALEQVARSDMAQRHVRDRALEGLGDLALAEGRVEDAIARYAEVMTRTVNEDKLRTLDVKIYAAKNEQARPAVIALLIGAPARPPDPALAAELLGAWSARAPDESLPLYLLGRHYVNKGFFEEAAARLDRALAAGISIPRVRVEAMRLRMVVACGLGDAAAATRFYERYAAEPGVSGVRVRTARELVERGACAPLRARGESPERGAVGAGG